MTPEMEHKYHTESKESVKTCTKTKIASASSSVCTKTKAVSTPSSVCSKSKTTSASSKVCTKTKTSTIPSTVYTEVETKTVSKPSSVCNKSKSKSMSASTETAYSTLTKTFAASTYSQASPTPKPCSCKYEEKHDQPCSCKQKHEHKHEEHEQHEQPCPCKEHKEAENKCPGSLSKGFEVCLMFSRSHKTIAGPLTLPSKFPHLIIPVDSSMPEESYHTSFNGTASGSVSTIFNFDIPASDAGKTCSLEFLFPEQSQLETSAFSLTGSGEVEFSILESACVQGTTYENKPKTHEVLGTKKMSAGNSYHIHEAPCRAGQTVAIEMKAVGDTCLNYFQDFNPCPIGLYVNVD